MQPVKPFIRSPWGDRRELLPKRMTYVCSLDVAFFLCGSRYMTIAEAVREGPKAEGGGHRIFHAVRRLAPKGASGADDFEVFSESDKKLLPVRAQPDRPDAGRTYHVFGDNSFETANGLVQEVPLLRVIDGQAQLKDDLGGSALSFEGRLSLVADPKAHLLLDFEGVVAPAGGAKGLTEYREALPASASLSTRHQCDVPSLRWLNRCQLFGVGEVQFGAKEHLVPEDHAPYRYVQVRLDLLSAA